MKKYKIKISVEEIKAEYEQKGRFYHNFDHVEKLLKTMKIYDDALIVGVLFHDIVYDTSKRDNEEKSYEFFEERYRGGDNFAEKVKGVILVTKGDMKAKNKVEEEMHRIDRQILYSKDIEELLEWEKNIRSEYSNYSDEEYKNGRTKFLLGAIEETGNEKLKELIEKVNTLLN